MKHNDTKNRIYVAVIGILFLALSTIFPLQFALTFLCIWILCIVEYHRIVTAIFHSKFSVLRNSIQIVVSIVASIVFVYLFNTYLIAITNQTNRTMLFDMLQSKDLQIVTYLSILIVCLLWLFSVLRIWNHKRNILSPVYSAVYFSIPFLSIILTRVFFGWQALLLLFIGDWAMDSFSYVFGIRFGKHKIAPKISPKKSWEGLIGGIISSTVCFIVFYSILLQKPITLLTCIFAVCLPLFSFFGDLFESKIKRLAGVKDSGALLKGHGGVWDRFDSMLFYAVGYLLFLGII